MALGAAPSGRTLAIYEPNDALQIIDLLLVTGVELNPQKGAARRRN